MSAESGQETTSQLGAQCDELLRLARSAEPDLREIAGKVRRNQQLMQRFLRAVNSASLGLDHPISDVQHALAMLGTRRIATILEDVRRSIPRIPPVLPPPESAASSNTDVPTSSGSQTE